MVSQNELVGLLAIKPDAKQTSSRHKLLFDLMAEWEALVDKSFPFEFVIGAESADFAVLKLGGTAVTSSAAELNILDGVTATYEELNYVDVTTGAAAVSKALVLDGSGNLTWYDGGVITTGGTTGLKIGASAADKIGFLGATPIVQRANAAQAANASVTNQFDGADTVNKAQLVSWVNGLVSLSNELREALKAFGLIKGSA